MAQWATQRTLGVFVRHPVPGQVKTRLAESIGAERACEIYAAFVVDLVETLRKVGTRRWLCFAPHSDAAFEYFKILAGADFQLWPQPETALGERMGRFFDEQVRAASESAVIIGSDSPTLPKELIVRAFEALDLGECVIGPAMDGGYYLIGQRATARDLFTGVEWGTGRVFEQTVKRVAALGARLVLLPPWYDVDTSEDLEFLRAHLRALRHEQGSPVLPCTSRILKLDTENAVELV